MSVFQLPEGTFRAFIFDCDGTLADTMPLHHRAWKAALLASGANLEFTWELFVRRAGMTLEATVQALNREFELELDPAKVAALQRAEYQSLLPGIRPIEPVVEFLREIAPRAPVGVASGTDPATVRQTLGLIGVLPLVSVIVTSFEVPHGKPAPDLFLLAAARLGVKPSECVVFEDSPLGIEAAKRAGMAWSLVRADSTP